MYLLLEYVLVKSVGNAGRGCVLAWFHLCIVKRQTGHNRNIITLPWASSKRASLGPVFLSFMQILNPQRLILIAFVSSFTSRKHSHSLLRIFERGQLTSLSSCRVCRFLFCCSIDFLPFCSCRPHHFYALSLSQNHQNPFDIPNSHRVCTSIPHHYIFRQHGPS